MKKETKFKMLVSPTRGENYTVQDALSKYFHRAYFDGEIEIIQVFDTMYGDKDYIVRISNLSPSDPIWNESINVIIDGDLLLHSSAGGKLSLGWGCGKSDRRTDCYTRHKYPDITQVVERAKKIIVDNYEYCGDILIEGEINEVRENIGIDQWSFKERKLLLDIVKEYMSSCFLSDETRVPSPYHLYQDATIALREAIEFARIKYGVKVEYDLKTNIINVSLPDDTSSKIKYFDNDEDIKINVSEEAYRKNNQVVFRVLELFGLEESSLSMEE